MTFEDMVNKYLPLYHQLDIKNVVRRMFWAGLYAGIVKQERKVFIFYFVPNLCLFQFYGDRLILVDGGILKVEPWKPLADVERVLFPDEKNLYFTEKRFHKRSDGYYCLVRSLDFPAEMPDNLICMPESKGRSKGEVIPENIRRKLEEFYYPVNREAGIDFSWI